MEVEDGDPPTVILTIRCERGKTVPLFSLEA